MSKTKKAQTLPEKYPLDKVKKGEGFTIPWKDISDVMVTRALVYQYLGRYNVKHSKTVKLKTKSTDKGLLVSRIK